MGYPPSECEACDSSYACHPGAEGYNDYFYDNYSSDGAAGGPPIVMVVPIVAIFLIVLAIKRSRDQHRLQETQRSQQAGQGGVAIPPARATMPVPVPQVMAPVTTSMQIMIPPTACPGQSIQVNVNGQMMSIVVPPGAVPGSTMTIQVPAPQQAVVPVVQTAVPMVSAVPMAQASAVPMAVTAQQQQPVDEGGIMMGIKLS